MGKQVSKFMEGDEVKVNKQQLVCGANSSTGQYKLSVYLLRRRYVLPT